MNVNVNNIYIQIYVLKHVFYSFCALASLVRFLSARAWCLGSLVIVYLAVRLFLRVCSIFTLLFVTDCLYSPRPEVW